MMIDLLGADFLPLTDTGVLEMLRCYFFVWKYVITKDFVNISNCG